MIFDGRTLRTEAKGGIVPDTYHKGDRIKIEDMSVENAPEDAEIGVTEEFQKTVDKGTSKALTALEYFLNEHPMFGTIEKLGFQLE
jgi:hypothetical protein